jgi:hypothetical protein
MNYNLELQLSELREVENKIKLLYEDIARTIFTMHASYEPVNGLEIKLLAFIEYAKEKHEKIFSFNVSSAEKRRLNQLRSDVAAWIEEEYSKEAV